MKFDKSGLEEYIIVEELELNGVWIDNFPEGRSFKVKRPGGSNRKFTRMFQAAVKPYKRQGRINVDIETGDRIMRHVYAHTVVVDWRNINDDEGNPVPCTPENVEAYFEAFPELFNDLVNIASDMALFSEQMIKDAEQQLGED